MSRILLGFALVLAAGTAQAAPYRCERFLLDRIFDRVVAYGDLSEPVDLRPISKKVRLTYEVKPEFPDHFDVPRNPEGRFYYGYFGYEALDLAVLRVSDMSAQAMVFKGASYRSGKLRLDFEKDPRLISDAELVPRPEWVEAQRRELALRFPGARWSGRFPPSAVERYYEDRPSGEFILSAKTLQRLPTGLSAFVRLRGENFLRLGSGHHMIGAREIAVAAGDIFIERDAVTGEKQVVFLSPRSDTYRPSDDSLVRAVEALWWQNVFPRHLQLRAWDNKGFLLAL